MSPPFKDMLMESQQWTEIWNDGWYLTPSNGRERNKEKSDVITKYFTSESTHLCSS